MIEHFNSRLEPDLEKVIKITNVQLMIKEIK